VQHLLISVLPVQDGLKQENALRLLPLIFNSKSSRKSGRIVNGWDTIGVWAVLMISTIWRQYK